MKKKQLTIADLSKADLIRICQVFIDNSSKLFPCDTSRFFSQKTLAVMIYEARIKSAVQLNTQALADYEKAKKIRCRKKREIAMAAAFKKHSRAEKIFNGAQEFRKIYELDQQ